MNVNSLPDKSVIAASTSTNKLVERAAAPAPNQAQPSPDSNASVEVKLSPVTQTMTNNVARSGTDVFDATKVQAMRTAIQNGSFSVNAEAIADKMLANAREMMSVASAGPTNTAGNNPSM
jgi:negative regulator of flagellin synthesis FlgM